MNVIVHFPEDPDAIKSLEIEVTKIHSSAIVNYLNNLKCPKELKLQILKELKAQYKSHNK